MGESLRQEGPNVLVVATLKRVVDHRLGSASEVWAVEVVLSPGAGHEALRALRLGVLTGTTELDLAGRSMRAVVVPVERAKNLETKGP
jgi:hypothetical protein